MRTDCRMEGDGKDIIREIREEAAAVAGRDSSWTR